MYRIYDQEDQLRAGPIPTLRQAEETLRLLQLDYPRDRFEIREAPLHAYTRT